LRGVWSYRPPERVPATMALLAACIGVFAILIGTGGQSWALRSKLAIAPMHVEVPESFKENAAAYRGMNSTVVPQTWIRADDLSRIRHGEVWRLVSPIFLHFGFLHLLFCLYWLNDIGGMVEIRKGTLWLVGLVVLIAVPSNLAQYAVDGANFGGMMPIVL